MNRSVKALLFSSCLAAPAVLAATGAPKPAEDPAQDSLLVWGSIRNGVGSLNPAIPSKGVSAQPEPGPYALKFLDADGNLLQEVSFQAVACADLPEGEDVRSFTFVVPLGARVQERLVAIDLCAGAATLATLRASNGQAVAAPLRRAPTAQRTEDGLVRLEWEAASHPRVLVVDLATGAAIGMGVGGRLDLRTTAETLEVTLLDGLRSQVVRVAVP